MAATMGVTPGRLWTAYAALVAGATVWLASGAAAQPELGAAGAVFVGCGVAALALVPRLPVVALIVFVLAAHVAPRYGHAFTALLDLALLNWIAGLAFLGWIVWLMRRRSAPQFDHWLTRVMCAFTLWIGITILVAWSGGSSPPWYPRHHPEQYFQAFALFVLAVHGLGNRAAAWSFALALAVLPSIQGIWLGNARLHLDTDLPAFAAIVLPAAVVGVWHAPHWLMRAAFALAAVDMLRIIALTHNRAAAVGLACGLVALWFTARHRLRWALVGVPLVLVAVLVLVPRGYIDRFRALWDPRASHSTATLDRATVQGRLELWQAGIGMVRDHPLVGVGPGNFSHAVKGYLPRETRQPTHSNVLNIAAETGLPGLVLYVVLFAGGVIVLYRVVRRRDSLWPEPGARMVQASLVAYLAVGMFLSRQDMQLAYLFLGWAVALDGYAPGDRPAAAHVAGSSERWATPGGRRGRQADITDV